ncbi:Enoyl-[acyl-carrier-protein] reductase [NADH] [Planifilum fulgidum]|jgi:enoyl-[acyl-carrier protein] reductase I|uniref:Enoyl-[acyl-carrier-protein] reductase [NADH] n=1 Tax=Planifilum fulgidum TaxID=201973 RepID=A0A1I2PXC1_9BACL|nr:enoyl-ACP reductase FabI [Planifilum fulgidum]MBO2496102.1 enoyl-[acyl-carrier-protein] reductase FabI [Bacillota bacterium]MBO2532440.1 enoyl-[acyl-carrier-protein] reductase FabI [Thermoactinomycetaceae bacterium]SFG18031.1 Enoyl-[acyl-carrier-protein] reductase [NADH] [Planifilum fulgidum]
MTKLLEGKRVVIMGVANKRSIAWAIAQSLHNHGAELAFTYQGERLERRVRELVEAEMPGSPMFECDVTSDEQVRSAFDRIGEVWGRIDGLVHCIAFAKAEDLEVPFVETSRDGYALAQDISSYSLVACARAAKSLMTEGGSILTMTYMGSERVIPNYNVMGVAKAALEASVRYLAYDLGPSGIRVNAISAGPIRTLAAKGVKNFNSMLHIVEERSPLRKTTDPAEVADTALFLISPLSRGITGEVIHVDGGYNIMGM